MRQFTTIGGAVSSRKEVRLHRLSVAEPKIKEGSI